MRNLYHVVIKGMASTSAFNISIWWREGTNEIWLHSLNDRVIGIASFTVDSAV